jgi:hypothetical protein
VLGGFPPLTPRSDTTRVDSLGRRPVEASFFVALNPVHDLDFCG